MGTAECCGARPLVTGAEIPPPPHTTCAMSNLRSCRRCCRLRSFLIVLRDATQTRLDDLERGLDDAVDVIKALLRGTRLVLGSGAAEIELSRRMGAYGGGLKGLAQHFVRRRRWEAISRTLALEVIPRTLAENALGSTGGLIICCPKPAFHPSPSSSPPFPSHPPRRPTFRSNGPAHF